MFLNKGRRVEPFVVKVTKDSAGNELEIGEPEADEVITAGNELEIGESETDEVITEETAYLTTNMLEDVVQMGTGRAAKVIDRPIAGKTGTTNDYVNAWFIGGAPNLVTGVYVGFDDRRSLGASETGAHSALPIWIGFMKDALAQLPVAPFEIPDGVTFVKVDSSTGLLESEEDGDAQNGVVELFARGSEPTQAAPRHVDPTDFYKLDHIPEGQLVQEGGL